MLRTNKEALPIVLVQGEVRHSRSSQTFRLSADGEPFILPATGGITYNAKIGDPCCGWAAAAGAAACGCVSAKTASSNSMR